MPGVAQIQVYYLPTVQTTEETSDLQFDNPFSGGVYTHHLNRLSHTFVQAEKVFTQASTFMLAQDLTVQMSHFPP